MPKIDIEMEMPLYGNRPPAKRICRPNSCSECLLCLDEHITWCAYYHRKVSQLGNKPTWCRVEEITVLEGAERIYE